MIVKVLRKERVGGFHLEPGEIKDVPTWVADAAGDAVEKIGQEKMTNLELEKKLSGTPKGSRVLVKLPEGDDA